MILVKKLTVVKIFQFSILFVSKKLNFESATTDIRVHLDCKENPGVGYDVGDKVVDFLIKI